MQQRIGPQELSGLTRDKLILTHVKSYQMFLRAGTQLPSIWGSALLGAPRHGDLWVSPGSDTYRFPAVCGQDFVTWSHLNAEEPGNTVQLVPWGNAEGLRETRGNLSAHFRTVDTVNQCRKCICAAMHNVPFHSRSASYTVSLGMWREETLPAGW